jgi:hypothetical protein
MATVLSRGLALGTRIGREVGRSAQFGPLLGSSARALDACSAGVDGSDPEQEAEEWLIQTDDIDDDLGRPGRVARPGVHGGLG